MMKWLNKIKNRRLWRGWRDDLICSEIFESVSILADGSVTCGCADIYELRVLGNVKEQSLEQIFDNEKFRELRRRMLSGDLPPQCIRCPLRIRARTGKETIEAGAIQWIQVDPIFNCNLRCPHCAFTAMRDKNYFIRPRSKLSLDTFKSIIDQGARCFRLVRFHMLGEPFLNKDFGNMLLYLREKIPGVFVSMETNGTLIGPDVQQTLVKAGVDYVKFSVDGASQETYGKYRVGGDFEQVYQNMAGLIRERNQAGADRPRVVWQYILFEWNDSDQEIEKAKRMAGEAGVNELYFLMTHTAGASRRFLPGNDYPIFKEKKVSLHQTVELASRERRPMPRPAPTLEEYDPWK